MFYIGCGFSGSLDIYSMKFGFMVQVAHCKNGKFQKLIWPLIKIQEGGLKGVKT